MVWLLPKYPAALFLSAHGALQPSRASTTGAHADLIESPHHGSIAMAATSVLLGSTERATECLLIMGAGTGEPTAFPRLYA